MANLKSKEDLFIAIKEEGIPLDVNLIWNKTTSPLVAHTCESPSFIFDAFLVGPEMFPFPNELLILWDTNSSSIVGYLREKKYTSNITWKMGQIHTKYWGLLINK